MSVCVVSLTLVDDAHRVMQGHEAAGSTSLEFVFLLGRSHFPQLEEPEMRTNFGAHGPPAQNASTQANVSTAICRAVSNDTSQPQGHLRC